MSGPVSPWLSPLTVPASWLYGAAISHRNRLFDRSEGIETVARPVISIGNISTGGTGKTPMVAWLASRLSERGLHTAIAMRGYRSRPGAPGDEELEYASLIPNTPVIADPKRATAIKTFLSARPETDAILLDDGFQHRQLHRNLDLVLIDATRPALEDRLLPAGWLREPIEGLRRADAVIVTRAAAFDPALSAAIESRHGRPPVAWSRHIWKELHLHGAGESRVPVEWLNGRRVAFIAGVGNPEAVRTQLTSLGASVVADFRARDHQHFSSSTVNRFLASCPQADAIFATPKDWVKLREVLHSSMPNLPIVVPTLEIEVFRGGEELVNLAVNAIRP